MYQLAKMNHRFPTEWSHVLIKKENKTVKKGKKGKQGCGGEGGGSWKAGESCTCVEAHGGSKVT